MLNSGKRFSPRKGKQLKTKYAISLQLNLFSPCGKNLEYQNLMVRSLIILLIYGKICIRLSIRILNVESNKRSVTT